MILKLIPRVRGEELKEMICSTNQNAVALAHRLAWALLKGDRLSRYMHHRLTQKSRECSAQRSHA